MADVSESGILSGATLPATGGFDDSQPGRMSKWYRWRKNGAAVLDYLLDAEVHTYAFSVAANAIISFIPFIVLLYTISRAFFHSDAMVEVVGKMVHYFLPSNQDWVAASLEAASARHGVQVFSIVMILISCTGIFLPLEVALNQTYGVIKHRNYLMNQLVAFGLAIIMVVLAMLSIVLSAGERQVLGFIFFHHTDNIVFEAISFMESRRICSAASNSLILDMAKPTWMRTQSPVTGMSSARSPSWTLRRTPATSTMPTSFFWSAISSTIRPGMARHMVTALPDSILFRRSRVASHSFFRATISNENLSSSFTLIAPPATEIGLMP